jgi:hypothetical protein
MNSIPSRSLPPSIPGKVYIYALHDPRTGDVRYVGQTTDPRGRLSSHLHTALKQRPAPRDKWIASLRSMGLAPQWQTLDIVDTDKWVQAERDAIGRHRALGCQLTNASDGGIGPSGYTPSPETIQRWRISIHARNKKIYQARATSESSIPVESTDLAGERDAWKDRALAAEARLAQLRAILLPSK